MDSNPGISLFQAGSINVENALQNQEEQEDLEDQERRKQEIQSLLTKAMDEFNYDDQSTINSSTNVSVDDYRSKYTDPAGYEPIADYHYEQKYKESGMEDQLKVLYEVRVREVQSLTEQVNILKAQLIEQKDSMTKKLMLEEAEKERAQVSLRQSQELLIEKTEEISKFHKDTENFQKSIKQLEANIQSLEREQETLKHTNRDLIEQLTIMQKGLSTNTVSERQLQENHHTELTKLQHNLENALTKLERKENENSELEQMLHKKVQEKDEMMAEKCGIINQLGSNLDDAQHQCRELLQLVDSLSQENQKLKRIASNYDLANSMQATLSDKSEIIKVLQKELDKATDIQKKHLVDFEALQKTYSDLKKETNINKEAAEALKIENMALEKTNAVLENRIKLQFDEISKLNEKLDKCLNVYNENEILEKRINSLQVLLSEFENRDTREHSVQVSQIMSSFCEQNDLHKEEIEKLEQQLEECRNDLTTTCRKLLESEDEIKRLQTKVSLENERDKLIQSLQEKAVQFQKIILERQEKPASNSVGVNTDKNEDNIEFLKAQFETELIEKEIQIRLQIQNEYESKTKSKPIESILQKSEPCQNCQTLNERLKDLETVLKTRNDEYQSIKNKLTLQSVCQDCSHFKDQLKMNRDVLEKQSIVIGHLKEQQVQDRETIVKILEDWKLKFHNLEKSKQALIGELVDTQKNCSDLETKLKIREKGDSKLVEELQKETMALMKQWNKQALESIQKLTSAQLSRVLESRQRIDNISRKADKKVKEIESKYKKTRAAIEQGMR